MENKNQIPGREEIAKLPPAQKMHAYYRERKKKKFKRWYYIYLATTISVVLLVCTMLAIGAGRENTGGNKADTMASLLLSLDFMNISGEPGSKSIVVNGEQKKIFEVINGILTPEKGKNGADSDDKNPSEKLTKDKLYTFDYSKVPAGQIPIVPMDLSLSGYGSAYIYNTSGYNPNLLEMLASDFTSYNGDYTYLSAVSGPVVLILHTHGTEAYSENGAVSYIENGELARSADTSENVVAVGAVIADYLNKNGIPTLHSTIMHDQASYKDSYDRAEETIKQYLAMYPTIKLVIDLHRDSIVKSTGELVRPVTLVDSNAAAQIMCVVGSDSGDMSNTRWQGNLALALQLRESLNATYEDICRPAYLRPSTYNQEYAPYSLLLEIGASGNSIEEAIISARAAAEALVPLIRQM